MRKIWFIYNYIYISYTVYNYSTNSFVPQRGTYYWTNTFWNARPTLQPKPRFDARRGGRGRKAPRGTLDARAQATALRRSQIAKARVLSLRSCAQGLYILYSLLHTTGKKKPKPSETIQISFELQPSQMKQTYVRIRPYTLHVSKCKCWVSPS